LNPSTSRTASERDFLLPKPAQFQTIARPDVNMASTKVGHALAKGLGIKLNYRNELNDEIRRGESVFSSTTADTYVEEEPTSLEWVQDTLPSGHDLVQYTRSLFPFLHWIGSYNLQWLAGDLVAGKHPVQKSSPKDMLIQSGITIGAVVVPQGMAYAVLADLKPQFGLYSSFMGVLIYWFFATSKDITIGVSHEICWPRSQSNEFKACRCNVDSCWKYSREGGENQP